MILPEATWHVEGCQDFQVPIPLKLHCCNPSLLRFDGRLLFAWRAAEFGCSIYLSELKEDWGSMADLIRLELPGRVEDPRLFVFKGRLWIAFTCLDTGGGYSQGIARLTSSFQAAEFFRLESPIGFLREKNWEFFDYEGELFAIHSIQPHLIGRVRGARLVDISSVNEKYDWNFGLPRGGSPPIRVGDEYFCFFHSSYTHDERKVYVTGVHTFEAKPPFLLARWDPEPLSVAGVDHRTNGPLVVFPGSAFLEGSDWIIAYGWHNSQCRILRVPAEVVNARLMPVSKGPVRFELEEDLNRARHAPQDPDYTFILRGEGDGENCPLLRSFHEGDWRFQCLETPVAPGGGLLAQGPALLECFRRAESFGCSKILLLAGNITFSPWWWRGILRQAVMELPPDWSQLYLGALRIDSPVRKSNRVSRVRKVEGALGVLYSRRGMEIAKDALLAFGQNAGGSSETSGCSFSEGTYVLEPQVVARI